MLYEAFGKNDRLHHAQPPSERKLGSSSHPNTRREAGDQGQERVRALKQKKEGGRRIQRKGESRAAKSRGLGQQERGNLGVRGRGDEVS